jgi:hypothetical protein
MTRGIIVILYILLALLVGGCSNSSADSKLNPRDSLTAKKDVKKNLSEIQETFNGFDYESVVSQYSARLRENTSITKFALRNFLRA